MELSDDDIRALAGDIWSSILGLELEPGGPPEGAATEASFTGVVHVQGEWHGSVTVQCPESLAKQVASIMFDLDEADLGRDDVDDALGEITNMTGGSVKALVPGHSELSLPTVVEGNDYTLKVPGTEPIREVWMACSGTPLVVRVLERTEAGAG